MYTPYIGFGNPIALLPYHPVAGVLAMLERAVEEHLVGRVKAAGGLALKWVAPGLSGVPDRICILPGGKILFVELKAPGKQPTALQLRVHEMLRRLGAEVHVVDSKEGVNAIL